MLPRREILGVSDKIMSEIPFIFGKFSHKIEKFRQNKIDKNNIIFYRFFLSISNFYRFFGLIDNYRFIDFFYRKKTMFMTVKMTLLKNMVIIIAVFFDDSEIKEKRHTILDAFWTQISPWPDGVR